MKLSASIASYNSNGQKARNKLNNDYIDLIHDIATNNKVHTDIDVSIIDDLISMNILKRDQKDIKLNTAVFLEKDIEKVSKLANKVGFDLANLLVKEKTTLDDEIPEIKTFFAAVIAVTQGLSQYVFSNNLGSEWKSYEGEYAKTKIDFDEICEVGSSIGSHLLQKSIIVGDKYTAVFIGPKCGDVDSIIRQAFEEDANIDFNNHKEIIDNIGLLYEGKILDPRYDIASKHIGVLNKRYIVTNDVYENHKESIERIKKLSSDFYSEEMSNILATLSQTTSGKHGVKPDSMLMHFWRYFSRVLAYKLYEAEYLTDNLRLKGLNTVLFKNDIKELNKSFY